MPDLVLYDDQGNEVYHWVMTSEWFNRARDIVALVDEITDRIRNLTTLSANNQMANTK